MLLADAPTLDPGNTTWMLVSAAFVMLMTPGLAFFYGGLVRSKNVLNMLMMNFVCLGIVGLLWTFYGYSLVFGEPRGGSAPSTDSSGAIISTGGGVIGFTKDLIGLGNPDAALTGLNAVGVPVLVFAMFQLMFAIITPALISGAIADRVKFTGWCIFVALWVTLVYFPVANWVFGSGWILNRLRAEDFAGGTAVHINAGAAALALVLVIGPRKGWRKEPMRPHNVPFVLLGASLLWFGWYGFNAGSEGAADLVAGLAFTTTTVATCAAMLSWLLVEKIRDGKPTTVGAASGAVAGLVAITPACAFVSPMGGICIGLIAGALCCIACSLKFMFRFDDALDIVGVHLVGGITGTLAIGFFGFDHGSLAGFAEAKRGLFYGGGLKLLLVQFIAAGSVLIYSFVVTFIIGTVLKKVGILRVNEETELVGLDEVEHAETAYSAGVLGGSISSSELVGKA